MYGFMVDTLKRNRTSKHHMVVPTTSGIKNVKCITLLKRMYAQTTALTLQWKKTKITTCTTKNKGRVNILESLGNHSKPGNPFRMTIFNFASNVPTTTPASSASTHKSLDARSCISRTLGAF